MKRLLLVCICLLGFSVSGTFIGQDIADDCLPPIVSPGSNDNVL